MGDKVQRTGTRAIFCELGRRLREFGLIEMAMTLGSPEWCELAAG